jgi:hypothetical protein
MIQIINNVNSIVDEDEDVGPEVRRAVFSNEETVKRRRGHL